MYVYILDKKMNKTLYYKIYKELSTFLKGFVDKFEFDDFGTTFNDIFTKDNEMVSLKNDSFMDQVWIRSTIELPQYKKYLSTLKALH